MKRLFSLLIIFLYTAAFAQQSRTFITETDNYIAWQPNVKLTFEMFKKSEPTERDLKIMGDDNRNAVPYLGFYRVLDVPKKKSGWKKGQEEKAYFCAMFSKHQSYVAVKDTFDLQIAQAQWDILELGTRKSRIELDSLQRAVNKMRGGPVTGVVDIFFSTAHQEGIEFDKKFSYGFFKEVIIPRDYEMYLKYRALLDEMLTDTAEYATSPEEAERLLLGKPIEKYLTKAKKVVRPISKME